MAKKKQPKTEPRHLRRERLWYYVNRDSVDVLVREPGLATLCARLTRRVLRKMLAELS